MLCSHHTIRLQNFFIFSNWNFAPIKHLTPCHPTLAADIHHLLSVSMNLTTLGTAYKLDHIVFVLLCLATFTQHNVLEVHPCCSRCQNSLPFLRVNNRPLCGYVLLSPIVAVYIAIVQYQNQETDMATFCSVDSHSTSVTGLYSCVCM